MLLLAAAPARQLRFQLEREGEEGQGYSCAEDDPEDSGNKGGIDVGYVCNLGERGKDLR